MKAGSMEEMKVRGWEIGMDVGGGLNIGSASMGSRAA